MHGISSADMNAAHSLWRVLLPYLSKRKLVWALGHEFTLFLDNSFRGT